MRRAKAKFEDSLKDMADECKRKIEEAMLEEGKLAEDAEEKMNKLRIERAAECAKLVGKIELLEQQLLKAGDEENAQFVNGWNACESKFAGGGAKTRSSAH
eukprot:359454-Pleurochrysis_carterae.AAC.1